MYHVYIECAMVTMCSMHNSISNLSSRREVEQLPVVPTASLWSSIPRCEHLDPYAVSTRHSDTLCIDRSRACTAINRYSV